MPRKKSLVLSDHEIRLMEVLWARERVTVGMVVVALPPPLLAYSTVLTTLRTLENKGYIAHEKIARAYVYYPRVTRDKAACFAVADVVNRFFNGSHIALVASLLDDALHVNASLPEPRLEVSLLEY